MRRLRNRHLLALDALLLGISPFLLYALRFERFNWGSAELRTALWFAPLDVVLSVATFAAFGLYRRLWRYASIGEAKRILVAGLTASVITFLAGLRLLPALGLTPLRVPLSVLFSNGLLIIFIAAGSRILVRLSGTPARRVRTTEDRRVLIVGAGSAGHMLARELRENPRLNLHPVGYLDDDPMKHGLHLSDLPVLGPLSMTAEIIRRENIDVLVVAMPTAPGAVVRPLVRAALDAGIEARTVPGLSEVLSGRVSVSSLREVEIQDLLRREPVQTNMEEVCKLATRKTVLVTGAGGSIGSELCRQLAALEPSRLLLLGHGENPIFHILNELRSKFPEVTLVPIIADIRDRRRIHRIFADYRPFAVFHAAAHKHVPLMEENSIEAVTNNVRGTQNIVDAASEYGTEHFVLISTDKAVRPTNVMGATKRAAEHIVHHAAVRTGRNFVSVRFGNVLGSQGSVVPTFVKQIREGGPVTVTHPEMRRYFMTIPEAVQLVLQAGAMGSGGELFMLDMGEPVRIVDLAADLIRLSGLEVGTDIAIEFSGIRPGEKLYEEMFWDDEVAAPTEHPKILCARNHQVDESKIPLIAELVTAAMNNASDLQLRQLLTIIVPDFAWTPASAADDLLEQELMDAPAASDATDDRDGHHERRSLPASRMSEDYSLPTSAD